MSRPTAYARRRVVAALVGFHAFGNLTCLGNPRTVRAASASRRARRAGTLHRARVSTRRTRRGRARLRVDGAFREFAPAPATPDRLGARSSRHGTRWRAGVGTRRGFPRRASRVVGCCGDRPRGFVRNEIVRLITVLLRVVSVVQIKVARAPSAGRPETPRARGGAAENSVSEVFSSAWLSLPSARFAVESSSVECSSKRDSPSSALTWRQESIRDLAGHSPRFVNRQT